MTVNELIAKLHKVDPNLTVTTMNPEDGDTVEVAGICIVPRSQWNEDSEQVLQISTLFEDNY